MLYSVHIILYCICECQILQSSFYTVYKCISNYMFMNNIFLASFFSFLQAFYFTQICNFYYTSRHILQRLLTLKATFLKCSYLHLKDSLFLLFCL